MRRPRDEVGSVFRSFSRPLSSPDYRRPRRLYAQDRSDVAGAIQVGLRSGETDRAQRGHVTPRARLFNAASAVPLDRCGRVHEGEVAECLREVSELLVGLGVEFLGVKANVGGEFD